jgi:phage terminase small subunit
MRSMFKQMCELLSERRALSRGDKDLIRLYCVCFDRHRRNLELLKAEGEIVTYTRLDSNGQPHDVVRIFV